MYSQVHTGAGGLVRRSSPPPRSHARLLCMSGVLQGSRSLSNSVGQASDHGPGQRACGQRCCSVLSGAVAAARACSSTRAEDVCRPSQSFCCSSGLHTKARSPPPLKGHVCAIRGSMCTSANPRACIPPCLHYSAVRAMRHHCTAWACSAGRTCCAAAATCVAPCCPQSRWRQRWCRRRAAPPRPCTSMHQRRQRPSRSAVTCMQQPARSSNQHAASSTHAGACMRGVHAIP